MAGDQRILKQDGCLNIATESCNITYHPNLNVIIVFDTKNQVKILDVHSGVILQAYTLSGDISGNVCGKYMPLQEKVLFWDGKRLGLRGDYNGVLLLDTIMQSPVVQNDDMIKLELLLSEAKIFEESLRKLEEEGLECPTDVSNELMEKIRDAHTNSKKGIKAQRWNTICLELPYSSLKMVANSAVVHLKRLELHIPALAISSAINERLTDLLVGSRLIEIGCNNGTIQRVLMYSEAVRRQTFEKWPHMDYNWALPDQMAQAGFYHQPSTSGEDRAMCFTCNVCLVCWEKTDEPWSEHERHSPTCPFVKGEYTQNVPLAVTYATNPAALTNGFDVISNSDHAHVLCTSSSISGEIIVWSIEKNLKEMHTCNLSTLMKNICPDGYDEAKITAMCVLPNKLLKNSNNKMPMTNSVKSSVIGSKLILGLCVKKATGVVLLLTVVDICESDPKIICDNGQDQKCLENVCNKYDRDDDNKTLLEKYEDSFDSNGFMPDIATIKFKISDKGDDFDEYLDDEIIKMDSNICDIQLPPHILSDHKVVDDEIDNNNMKTAEQMAQMTKKPKKEDINCYVRSSVNVTPLIAGHFEVAEITPTNRSCNQLLVKLIRTQDVTEDSMEVDDEDDWVSGQMLLFSCDFNGMISNDYTESVTFNRHKCPHQICILPACESSDRKVQGVDFDGGAICVVCADGSMQLRSLQDFKLITNIEVPNEQFVSAAYCKTLDRLCGCTKSGSLIFYSLHDTDNESGDETVDDENANFCCNTDFSLGSGGVGDGDLSETDGRNGARASGAGRKLQSETASIGTAPGPSTSETQTSTSSNLIAHKSDLSLEDLRTLCDLTQFDEMLTPYTAEVPSCWNELVQAQKQRKQPQHLRPGDDTHLTKTWRLHNDATTWDEHIIEVNLVQPVSLGHIDLKFSLYQPCPNPAAIQVTLLKQNTSGFGYRMKGQHSVNMGYKQSAAVDENIEFPLNNDGVHENPVLTEEYLQTHNAEILAGPIELSSCMDLCDQGGNVTLTSPKLFKTRARNFLLHIKTMGDPAKEGQGKTRGCDWLHEISITVRGTKSHSRIPNERLQRIAMLESNNALENLLKTLACSTSTVLEKNLAIDILLWICTIRLNRFRTPKSERYKSGDSSSVKSSSSSVVFTDNSAADMQSQQLECLAIIEKYLKDLLLNCIIKSNRTLAHKCVKLVLILTEGVRNLPTELQTKIKFDVSLKNAITATLPDLISSKYSSVVRWFILLTCSTSTADSHNSISEICVKLLMDITNEIEKRWDPYCSLLGTRFGLYGFPFEPELFDVDLPNMSKNNTSSPNTLVNIIRSNAGLLQSQGMDFKKLSSIDGVEFRSFPHLIKCKGVSNQLRGLLEVEQLHYICSATSEATRIDNMDSSSTSSASNINMEEIIIPTMSNNMDGQKDPENGKLNDIVNNVKNILADKLKMCAIIGKDELKANGIAEPLESSTQAKKGGDKSFKYKHLPKFKAICQYIECCDENSSQPDSDPEVKLSNKIIQRYLNEQNMEENTNVFPWHKILSPPPKQMVVIDRMHSGARRFVVLDFGSPILLTDVVIPSCDELASLHIDIWCFEEEADSVRLVVTQDIGSKTLVLSDLQPPPICRYMKITITGRYGMSNTKCKIPLGSFYGHTVVLDSDGYGDPLLQYMKHPPSNIQTQIKALKSLYEDVHCRYSLSSCKLMEMLAPVLNCELSNVAHMQAFINKQREDDGTLDSSKIVATYEECILLQHQINVIKNVILRLESSLETNSVKEPKNVLQLASRDKLRVLSQGLVEVLLHFSIEYGLKNILPLHSLFSIDVANTLFNTLVVSGDAHIQLATCSLLVRMCCFRSWWGDFLADIFCNLFSSQNSKIFPQDRIFFLLTYLGRRSIAMGTCRSIVIDAILKTLAKLLAPISPRYQANESPLHMDRGENSADLWSKSDLQLVTWLLLFLSVCLDDSVEKKDKSANRWEFMSCEADFAKTRSQTNSSSGKQLRGFKKRIIQQNKYSIQPYTDWGKKIFMIQNELNSLQHPDIFMQLAGKPKTKASAKPSTTPKIIKDPNPEPENNFDKGLKTIRLNNILIVIRGLIALLLEMDFSCNMDLFLLTCKVIARLVSACKSSVQLSKIVSTNQLEQLVRLAVWNDQQQPWAVHAITCLLQDLLDADKHFKDQPQTSEPSCSDQRVLEGIQEPEEVFVDSTAILMPSSIIPISGNSSMSYADAVKFSHLPSLIECEDTEFEDLMHEIDIDNRSKNLIKTDSVAQNKNNFNFFCKTVSSSMDARLDFGLDTNVEISIRRLTMISSLDMYASLPQILTNEYINSSPDTPAWPEYVTDIWSGPEYNCGLPTYEMFKNVFDCIFSDLHLQDTWVHLEQVLQIWLTLNSELSDKPYNSGLCPNDIPKIPFGPNAVQGLLLALAWHNDIKLRTWCLGFQCLLLACNSPSNFENGETSNNNSRIGDIIISDENFEKMLLRFFSGYGMSSSIITNRCAGPTICKHLHELLLWLHKKAEFTESGPLIKKKLKDTLLNVILQLIQPGGAICNQQGPIDAQSQLVRDLLLIQYDKADLNVSLSIIESVSFLVYNNIANADKIQCQRSSDANSSTNNFSSLFANVLGSENSKQNASLSDNSLIISLLKLSSSLIQTELARDENHILMHESDVSTESQTDETKAEQLNIDNNKTKVPCIADMVLRHFSTMKRLLGSLSNCSSNSLTLITPGSLYSMKSPDSTFLLDEPQTTTDAVFSLLMLLSEKASETGLVIAPLCQYLETNSIARNALPRLHLSEPFLWYILKLLEAPQAVHIFTEMGGIQIICHNLVKLNKVLVNIQPGLISLIMQHMTKNTKLKLHNNSSNGNAKKCTSQQNQRNQDGLINFAPFCSISSENDTAQSADVLILTPIASHRRPRTPAWSYMFYPNESHVDLTITLPTAILLKEIQLQPHAPTLVSCPSAVAVEISRDYGLGPIPFGQPLTTTGMTCIRLKLSKPEIATSIVLRLYRPKDSSNIGLTQIAILGNTIFSTGSNAFGYGPDSGVDDDSLAKTSVGWIRILARCYTVAAIMSENKLSKDVVGASSEYPGFLESCCSLMNIMPLIPNSALQNLETVLLKLGSYSRDLCLALIRILLWGTTPQIYKLSNEAVCDLLYDLATAKDSYMGDKIQVLLDWILKLRHNFNNRSIRCTNPQSGFVKVTASILWTVHSQNCIPNLADLITNDTFEACLYWIDALDNDQPLKVAFDSLLCSMCCVKPELFNQLLSKCDVSLMQHEAFESATSKTEELSSGITDDNKEASGSEWFNNVAEDNLSTLLRKPSYLTTIAMSCQSPLAIYELVDSGLPKLLAHALFDYCCFLSPEIKKMTLNTERTQSTSSDECLTDSYKAENQPQETSTVQSSLITFEHVPKILDFFSECCSEGHMRDMLGSYQGSIFWKPLLELLCNYRPIETGEEPIQQALIRMERATINFFTRVTSCHPLNQDKLTSLLITVIKKPSQIYGNGNKTIISGFTRQLVLQLLLENERILVSVRSKQPLQKRDSNISLVNNHPSKRVNAHHLLFFVSVNTKCQEILQNCVSDYSNIFLPSMHSESRQSDSSVSNISSSNHSENKSDDKSDAFEIAMDFNGHGLEFLSVAAGVTAKDKRIKDVKNHVAAIKDSRVLFPKFPRLFHQDDFLTSSNASSMTTCAQLVHPECPEVMLTCDTTISQILAALYKKGRRLSTPCITLNLIPSKNLSDEFDDTILKAANMEPLPSPLQRFSTRGGLSLLAQYLPTVYPDSSGRKSPTLLGDKEKSPPTTDWVKLEPNEEIYEDLEDPITETSSKQPTITSVPQHSLAAFGLFLRLPAYSDVLLRDKLRAQCLLRLVLGVTGDGEGNDIYSLSLAPSLPTLPFEVFRQLLDSSPLTTDDGMLLRRMVVEVGAMHLVLNCLGIFTHQSQNYQINGPQPETAAGVKTSMNSIDDSVIISDDKSHMYWAKGTGFGTGSTQQSWNVEQALLRQKSEEEHVTVLLQVLSSYINPGDKIPSALQCDDIMSYHEISDVVGELPISFLDLLKKSCLIPALSSYLRNDSVLDITRHIPLYRAILQLLRAISLSYQLVSLLQPYDRLDSSPSISELLANMKTCVDTYANRLKLNKKSNIKGQTQQVTVNIDDGDDEGLALLIPDIQETTVLVQKATNIEDARVNQLRDHGHCSTRMEKPLSKSIEERYLGVMKKMQFDSYEMIVESEKNGFRFAISHHFEKMVHKAGDRYHPSRVKRLAQEAVTLSTSLPLSYSSSVFVRCDTDRLDIMKVLITGPADTPYANGCFEFDVFFPPDYPNLPMLINLETNGRHSVRFNPNLYNDGKVCLSVLNTWHGRPEEKWNAQTSSFLQVLVSIQSLILVPEPYFNEPGFERSRGTPSGTHSSREYNSNIYKACVRWAMLEQIRNPSPCFKEVIHTHFWVKRHEICAQIEGWIEELSKPQYSERNTITFNSMVLRREYRNLREELAKLKVPEGLEDLDMPFNPNVTLPVMTVAPTVTSTTIATTTSTIPNQPSSSNATQQLHSPNTTPTSLSIEEDISQENATDLNDTNAQPISHTSSSEPQTDDVDVEILDSPVMLEETDLISIFTTWKANHE
ncbi:baculoviral IAP repeat-containing protein 6 isoform X1 [Eupeodes corollae]|uniref:baculoviral IAP repeat-containing protein 6 isoform X1 n=1 Tax=Eupeodes corollae TaxID=290404 RepID=UPI0024939360|nr:baculoviral IAP repeat-containing protein 6 isoform X1 [Eupeodes corollae]